MVFERSRVLVVKGFQHDGRAVADLAVGDMSIGNVYDGMLPCHAFSNHGLPLHNQDRTASGKAVIIWVRSLMCKVISIFSFPSGFFKIR